MNRHNRVNKNFYVTKVRVAHNCKFCGSLIKAGAKALTINPRHESRFWICETCCTDIGKFKRIARESNNVSFGDEGAVLANMDYLEELAEELADKCIDEELLYRFGIYKDK